MSLRSVSHHIHLLILILASTFALLVSTPSKGYAQDSIQELELNENAYGYHRSHKAGRVFAEIGMGMVGWVISATPLAIGFLDPIFLIAGAVVVDIIVTPITAEMVYQGGRLTGGRAAHWASYAGGYIGFASSFVVGTVGFCFGSDAYLPVVGVLVPVFSLIGSIIGYELSEKAATNRLTSERDKLMQGAAPMRSAPIMITLYTGRF